MFSIYPPRAGKKATGDFEPGKETELKRGNERILVVEDEPAVRELTVLLLEELGYIVEAAVDGAEGYLICEKMDQPFDLILTDVVMPNLSGPEMIKRVEKIWPGIKSLYMSGYTRSGADLDGFATPEKNFIQKPFRLEALARKIRFLLDS